MAREVGADEPHALTGTSTNRTPTNARPSPKPRKPSHKAEYTSHVNDALSERPDPKSIVQAKDQGRKEGKSERAEELRLAQEQVDQLERARKQSSRELQKKHDEIDDCLGHLEQARAEIRSLSSALDAERRQFKGDFGKHVLEVSILNKQNTAYQVELGRQQKLSSDLGKKLLDAELRADDWQHKHNLSEKLREALEMQNRQSNDRIKFLDKHNAALAITMHDLANVNQALQEGADYCISANAGLMPDLIDWQRADIHELPVLHEEDLSQHYGTLKGYLPPSQHKPSEGSAIVVAEASRPSDYQIEPSKGGWRDSYPAEGTIRTQHETQWSRSKTRTIANVEPVTPDVCPPEVKPISIRGITSTTPKRRVFFWLIQSLVALSLLFSTIWLFHVGSLARSERVMLRASGNCSERAPTYIMDQGRKKQTLVWLNSRRLDYLSTKRDGLGLGTHFGEYGVMS